MDLNRYSIPIHAKGENVGYKRNVFQALTMITQFGINMLVPIFLCGFLGMFLDRKFGTQWIFILLFFIGAAAGARNVYVFAKKISQAPSDVRNRDKAEPALPEETDEED